VHNEEDDARSNRTFGVEMRSRIESKEGIDDGIADTIAKLIRVTVGH
jgi:hypothetical protein